MNDRRELIFASASDLANSFLYYDRKGDEELPRGSIEEAIENGEITASEIVQLFAQKLNEVIAQHKKVDL